MPVQFMLHQEIPQDLHSVALCQRERYPFAVAAKSANGFDGPINNRRTGAPITIAGAFFASAYPFYGGCAWETFGSAGFLLSRSVNLRTAATLNRLTAVRGSSSTIGVTPNESRPQSVQNSRRSSSSNGSRRFTRRLQPHHPPRPLQPPHVQSPRPRFWKGWPMNSSPLVHTVGGATFARCNAENQHLFTVNAGVSGEEALQHASLLMSCVNTLTFLGAMDDGNEAMRWASHYLSEMAKALIDDVTLGLQHAQDGGL